MPDRVDHPLHPAPPEPSVRRLGVLAPVGGQQSRLQTIAASIALVLVAALSLALLWGSGSTEESEGEAPASSAPVPSGPVRVPAAVPTQVARVRLGPPRRIECKKRGSPGAREGAGCDRLPVLEAALSDAISRTVDCAPNTGEAGSISFVLSVDFPKEALRVGVGAGGKWQGPQARRAARCVEKALVGATWLTTPHRHDQYLVGILAEYPAAADLSGAGVLVFE